MDDDVGFRKHVICRNLRSLFEENIEILEYDSPDQYFGVSMIHDRVDFAFIDVFMPGVKNFQDVIADIQVRFPSCGIVVVTAFGDMSYFNISKTDLTVKKYYEKKNIVFLAKPFEKADLMSVIAQIIIKNGNKIMIWGECVENITSFVLHEINNIMQASVGYADLLKIRISELKRDRNCDDFLANIEDMDTMIDEVVRFSGDLIKYVNIGKRFFRREIENGEIDLTECLIESVDLIKKRAEKNHIWLQIDTEDNLYIKADKILVKNIITNLLINAVEELEKHRIDDKKVKISSYYDQELNANVLVVADNGPGVKKENENKIFDLNFSTKENKKESRGLGLYFVRKLVVEMFGGKIGCKSKEGKGTQFVLEFPK